jgi:hypothetical protein
MAEERLALRRAQHPVVVAIVDERLLPSVIARKGQAAIAVDPYPMANIPSKSGVHSEPFSCEVDDHFGVDCERKPWPQATRSPDRLVVVDLAEDDMHGSLFAIWRCGQSDALQAPESETRLLSPVHHHNRIVEFAMHQVIHACSGWSAVTAGRH